MANMDAKKIKISSALIIKNPSKKRMVRIIGEQDYENCDTQKMGFLFGFLDIDLGPQNIKIFDIINEGIGRYYKNLLEHDIAFDDLINFLNRRILQAFSGQDIKSKTGAIIGVLKDDKILFCASGKASSFLIFSQGVKKIFPEETEKTIDVSDKLFSYSLNGEILKNYSICFCNDDFKETVNPYHLEKAVKTENVERVMKNIKDYLLENGGDGQYAGIWIHYPSSNNTGGGENVLMQIFQNEQKTEKNLSPSIMNTLQSALHGRPIAAGILRGAASFLKIIFVLLKKFMLLIGFLLFNSFFIITNIRGKRKEKQLAVGSRFKGMGYKVKDLYNSLTAVSKILFLSLILFAAALTGVIILSSHQQKIKELKLFYKQNAETAEDLYNQAEGNVIFQQKNSAVKKLKSALKLIRVVPEEIYDGSYTALQNKIQDRLYKLQNISLVSNPLVLADWSADPNQNIYPPFYLNRGKVGVFSENEMFSVDVQNRVITKNQLKIIAAPADIYYFYTPESALYVLGGNGALQLLYPDSLISNLKEIVLHQNETTGKFTIYNDAMYVLSPGDKHFSIWKHNSSLSGFGRPSLWATDNIPEGGHAGALAVDSSSYVLFSNNQIYKYYQGRKMDWRYDAAEAPEGAAYVEILTNENYKNIYLSGKNIVSILSKDGDFLGHLILPLTANITHIAVDEAASTIYALDGKKIYAFSFSL